MKLALVLTSTLTLTAVAAETRADTLALAEAAAGRCVPPRETSDWTVSGTHLINNDAATVRFICPITTGPAVLPASTISRAVLHVWDYNSTTAYTVRLCFRNLTTLATVCGATSFSTATIGYQTIEVIPPGSVTDPSAAYLEVNVPGWGQTGTCSIGGYQLYVY
jgi:hypothetical protein